MTTPELITVLVALLPAIISVIGGQAILIRYRKSKEQEIELIRAVRERQYEAVQELYTLFGKYMCRNRSIYGSSRPSETGAQQNATETGCGFAYQGL